MIPSQCAGVFSAEVWSSADIGQLAGEVRRIMPQCPALLDPGVFLASLSSGSIPRVLVVRCGPEIVGVVCVKERKIAGIPIGLIYAEGTLGGLVLAETANREAVLHVALEKLLALRRVQGLRLLVQPDGYELKVAHDLAMSMGLSFCQVPFHSNHVRLPLPASYEVFLDSLRRRTRRNFRYCRKQFAAAGHRYVPRISTAEIRAAADRLKEKCRFKTSTRDLERVWKWIASVDRPFACGLRSRHGELLSVTAGFYDSMGATMLLQLNDDMDFERDSMSLILRGYLIESLIQDGVPNLFFWGGVGGPLKRYAEDIPGILVFLNPASSGWQMARSLVRILAPKRLQAYRWWS